jgi:class 3 adenylate cyclase/protein-S-isoprenylcysteine O-methyltransferase Ste14
MERKLAAILSADVQGYSRLMSENEEATVQTLTAYRELLAALIQQHRGRVVDAPGDNLLAAFASVVDAVQCAVVMQREVSARNATLPAHRQMAFRIGINLGDVLVEGERLYGDGVNIAARLEALAEGGGICVSGPIYEQVRHKLALDFADGGEQLVKNIPYPVHVYRVRPATEGLPAPAPGPSRSPATWPEIAGRPDIAVLVVPASWVLYLAIVCEILFMASPFALYYYTAYGPALNLLHRSPWTAWLTAFFLPHFSHTSHPLLNSLHELGGLLVLLGAAVFVLSFCHLYGAKLWRREVVTGGLYAVVRHPQYLGLALVGLGTLLIWPRFLVLIMYITMLFLYGWFARREEARCVQHFGDRYRAYQARTGALYAHRLLRKLPRLLPPSGGTRRWATVALYVGVLVVASSAGYRLRDYALASVSSLYTERMAVLSPAVLREDELRTALHVAMGSAAVQGALQTAGQTAPLLVYVIPVAWDIPDLPLELSGTKRERRGPYTPADFDRRLYKVLFTTVRTHASAPRGKAIVTTAYGRQPLLIARVNTETQQLMGIETPPAHVWWGDIPTPLF